MLTGKLVSEEIEVKATAAEVWKIYSTLQLAELAFKKLPHILQKFDVIEGDGGLGTVLNLTFAPGLPGPSYQIEKFTVVDDEKRIKLTEVIEGGYLAMGFNKFHIWFEVLEKDDSSCTTKTTIEYEIAEDASDKVSFVSTELFVAIMKAVADTLTKPKDA